MTAPKESRSSGAAPAAASVAIDVMVEAGAWADETGLAKIAARIVAATLAELGLRAGDSELSLVFTDDAHIRALNAGWRGKDKPTNVLSFPAFPPRKGAPLPPMLGDVILAFETVRDEARLEEKPFDHHLSHLLVHGLLHLLGYDHETDEDAEEMEALERQVLAGLAIADPYA